MEHDTPRSPWLEVPDVGAAGANICGNDLLLVLMREDGTRLCDVTMRTPDGVTPYELASRISAAMLAMASREPAAEEVPA